MRLRISRRKLMEHLLGISLVLSFVLPHTSSLMLLVNPLFFLIFLCFKENRPVYRYNWIAVIPIVFALLLNFAQPVKMKAIINAGTVLMYFMCFPLVGKVRVRNFYLVLALALIVFSQLVYIFHVPLLSDLLDRLYPIAEMDVHGVGSMRRNLSWTNVLRYRLGGMYRDPNICAKSLTMLLAAFLSLNFGKPLKKLIPYAAVCFLAVMATGSRTGFAVTAAIAVAFVFLDKRISKYWRWSVVLVAVGGMAFLLSSRFGMRSLNISQGFQNSASQKYLLLKDYLDHEESLFRLLTGYLDYDRFRPSIILPDIVKFDSDVGYLIYCFGFLGLAAILVYYVTIFWRMDSMRFIIFAILLWMLTQSVVMAYRSFFSFMLILSCVYNAHKRKDEAL